MGEALRLPPTSRRREPNVDLPRAEDALRSESVGADLVDAFTRLFVDVVLDDACVLG